MKIILMMLVDRWNANKISPNHEISAGCLFHYGHWFSWRKGRLLTIETNIAPKQLIIIAFKVLANHKLYNLTNKTFNRFHQCQRKINKLNITILANRNVETE